MKNSGKFAFVITLSILVIGMLFYYLKGEIKTPEVASTLAKNSTAEQKNMPIAIDANSAQPPQQPLHKTSAMAKEFYASKDLRAFVEQEKKRPQEGGMTYAYQAMAYCRNVQKMPSSMPYRPGADSVTYGKRLSTFNEMKYRCQGFSEEELSDQAFGALDRERKKQQDALAVVSSLLLQKNGGLSQAREDQKKYIDAMAALQDPVKIDDGISIVSIHTNKKGETGYWFDGRFDIPTLENNMVPVRDAMQLLPCSFGMTCDGTNQTVALSCVYQEKCYDSLADYVKNTIYAGNDSLFQQVLEIRDKMAQAMWQGETDKFLAPELF